MIQEQISTSSPKCLDGNAGFGIVAQTAGMAPNLARDVGSLSGYSHLFPAGDPKNPVAFLHIIRRNNGIDRHIVSRVADCGNDYSGRTNRIGHHWIIEEADVPSLPGGPAAIASQREVFCTIWNETPRQPSPGSPLPNPPVAAGICRHWQQKLGDAGWGGVVAERIEKGDPISIIFEPGTDMLPLLAEVFALLPPAVRWKTTFSTFFMKSQEPPAGAKVQVKCIAVGTDEIAFAKLTPDTLLIDLRSSPIVPPVGKYVEAARTGKLPTPISVPMPERAPIGRKGAGIHGSVPHTTAVPIARTAWPLKWTKAGIKKLLYVFIGLLVLALSVVGYMIHTNAKITQIINNAQPIAKQAESVCENVEDMIGIVKRKVDETDLLRKVIEGLKEEAGKKAEDADKDRETAHEKAEKVRTKVDKVEGIVKEGNTRRVIEEVESEVDNIKLAVKEADEIAKAAVKETKQMQEVAATAEKNAGLAQAAADNADENAKEAKKEKERLEHAITDLEELASMLQTFSGAPNFVLGRTYENLKKTRDDVTQTKDRVKTALDELASLPEKVDKAEKNAGSAMRLANEMIGNANKAKGEAQAVVDNVQGYLEKAEKVKEDAINAENDIAGKLKGLPNVWENIALRDNTVDVKFLKGTLAGTEFLGEIKDRVRFDIVSFVDGEVCHDENHEIVQVVGQNESQYPPIRFSLTPSGFTYQWGDGAGLDPTRIDVTIREQSNRILLSKLRISVGHISKEIALWEPQNLPGDDNPSKWRGWFWLHDFELDLDDLQMLLDFDEVVYTPNLLDPGLQQETIRLGEPKNSEKTTDPLFCVSKIFSIDGVEVQCGVQRNTSDHKVRIHFKLKEMQNLEEERKKNSKELANKLKEEGCNDLDALRKKKDGIEAELESFEKNPEKEKPSTRDIRYFGLEDKRFSSVLRGREDYKQALTARAKELDTARSRIEELKKEIEKYDAKIKELKKIDDLLPRFHIEQFSIYVLKPDKTGPGVLNNPTDHLLLFEVKKPPK